MSSGSYSLFFSQMTKPSMTGVSVVYSSVASSARSPWASSTGVVCVWKPVMDFGLPAWPTTSTAWERRKGNGWIWGWKNVFIIIKVKQLLLTQSLPQFLDNWNVWIQKIYMSYLTNSNVHWQRLEIGIQGNQHTGLHGRHQRVEQIVSLSKNSWNAMVRYNTP